MFSCGKKYKSLMWFLFICIFEVLRQITGNVIFNTTIWDHEVFVYKWKYHLLLRPWYKAHFKDFTMCKETSIPRFSYDSDFVIHIGFIVITETVQSTPFESYLRIEFANLMFQILPFATKISFLARKIR